MIENTGHIAVIARSEATKQSTLSLCCSDGLLREACHRARIRATRWLAMTVFGNCVSVDPAMNYRVTVNSFLAVGGDGFTVLKQGTARQFGIYDVDALYACFRANGPISPTTTDRIARLN